MTCEDLNGFDKWGEQFKAISSLEEEILAQKYIMSVQTKEDLHTQDMKYWDYHNYVIHQNSFDTRLFDLVNDLHNKQRGKDYNDE